MCSSLGYPIIQAGPSWGWFTRLDSPSVLRQCMTPGRGILRMMLAASKLSTTWKMKNEKWKIQTWNEIICCNMKRKFMTIFYFMFLWKMFIFYFSISWKAKWKTSEDVFQKNHDHCALGGVASSPAVERAEGWGGPYSSTCHSLSNPGAAGRSEVWGVVECERVCVTVRCEVTVGYSRRAGSVRHGCYCPLVLSS